MNQAQQRWELRHREAASQPPPDPAPFLVETFPLLPRPRPRSRALDLACGAGQNAVWLAERGWPVVAVDFAAAALDRAAALAAARRLSIERRVSGALPERFSDVSPLQFVGADPRVRTKLPERFSGLCLLRADLENLVLPPAAFDLILCFLYLDRGALRRIERALAPRGYLLYETFTEGQRAFPEGPHSTDHLLRPGELRSAFPGLVTLFYREWTAGRAMASLLARKW